MAQTRLNEEQVDLTSYKKAEQTTAEISAAVQTHNTAGDAHADIRTTLAGKAEQTDLEAHTADTDNPHSVTKAQVGLGNVDNTADADKPVSSAVQAALERKQDDDEFHPEDYGWPDIRPAARPNAIVLLAGVKADYSAYDNLGFKATCEGGYNVFIDGVQYGTTYASGAQCSITWSQYSATAGFSVTQPAALTAHIVQIVPATADNNITAFKCVRVATSGQETQGVLWVHFNLQNAVTIQALLQDYASLYCPLCKAITAVNDLLQATNALGLCGQGADRYSYGAELDYCVPLDFSGASASLASTFNMVNGNNGALRAIILKNIVATDISSFCANATSLKEIKTEGVSFKPTTVSRAFLNCLQLKRLPQIDFTNTTSAFDFVKGASGLQDIMLDLSYANLLTTFHFYNTPGLKGLLVSSQAPFDYTTAPQINVSYTGLDQAALAALFKSLPYNVGYSVVGNPTIQNGVASGFSTSSFLKLERTKEYNTFEMCGKFQMPSAIPSAYEYIRTFYQTSVNCGLCITPAGKACFFIGKKEDGTIIQILSSSSLELAKTYRYKMICSGSNWSLWMAKENDELEEIGSVEAVLTQKILQNQGIGICHPNSPYGPFSGTIFVSEMNEIVDGVPYFRGTAAMDKTINITGATGAASLTAEQLAIATDKGWTVTR